MTKPLSFETIFAALAVLSVSSATGCSKSESAAPAPETRAPAAQATAAASSPNVAPAATTTTTAVTASAEGALAVDAGKEMNRPAPPMKKGAAASCGATGCSPEMKKGK